MFPLLGVALMAGGIIESLTHKAPKYNSSAMAPAGSLIEQQYGNINDYFDQANTAFEGQYSHYYGQTMQDSVNNIAGSGVYESPVSQNYLNRQQMALGDTYSTAKSQLAGQKMTAIGQVDQQKIGYLQNVAQMQYQRQLQQSQAKNNMFGAIGGIGSALLMA